MASDMKKVILPLSAMVLSFLTYGQSFQILGIGGQDITGTTISMWGDTAHGVLIYYPGVKNITSSDIGTKLKVVPNLIVPNSGYSYCLDGPCYTLSAPVGQSETAPVTIPILANSTFGATVLECLINKNLGMSSITYIYFNAANTSDTAFITIEYNVTPVGIKNNEMKEVEISGAYPNPAGAITTINYNTENNYQRSSILIHDMLGNTVKSFDLAPNNKGRINILTSEMPNGVYFYTLNSSGKAITTKKLILNH